MKKHKEKDKKSRRHGSNHNHSSKHSKKKRKHERKRRRSHSASSSDSNHSVSSNTSDFSSSKRHQSEQQHEHNQNHDDRKIHFVNQLTALFSTNPELSSDLPYFLIRLASGTSFNLSQMPDQRIAQGLTRVFQSLTPFGVAYDATSESWTWNGGEGGNQQRKDDLILIKIVRALLDSVGVTLDAVESFEQRIIHNKYDTKNNTGNNVVENKEVDEIASLTSMMLEQFQNAADSESKVSSSSSSTPQQSKTTSLAMELASISNMILEGEIISIDGIPDPNLREAVEKLFLVVGLVQSEMADDSESDNDSKSHSDEEDPPTFGFVLPEDDDNKASSAQSKLISVLNACKEFHQLRIQQTQPKKRVYGVSLPPSSNNNNSVDSTHIQNENELDESDDNDGPAPAGSIMAKKREMKGPILSSQMVTAMAQNRQSELSNVLNSQSSISAATTLHGSSNTREEWMMQPGEHDFLKGVLSQGTIKNRTFRNMKSKDTIPSATDEHVNPHIQKEIDTIIQTHAQSRGPSLLQQHREQKAQMAAANSNKNSNPEWKWSRETDLDSGRRVDKNHLHMIMGGAKKELQDKFSGGLSKGFM